MQKRTILVVDDDPNLRDVVSFALDKGGMRAVAVASGEEALAALAKVVPDLVILDVMMPGIDGLETCRRIRATSQVPILFLSSRDEEIDKIVGLELGADDYVTKPFSPRELVTRVNVILRRSQKEAPAAKPAASATQLRHGGVAMDTEQFHVAWRDSPISLTATEFAILRTLLKRPQRVVTRDDLIDNAYGHAVSISDRTIDSHVRNIRTKFAAAGGENVVETVHGIGYKLGPCT